MVECRTGVHVRCAADCPRPGAPCRHRHWQRLTSICAGHGTRRHPNRPPDGHPFQPDPGPAPVTRNPQPDRTEPRGYVFRTQTPRMRDPASCLVRIDTGCLPFLAQQRQADPHPAGSVRTAEPDQHRGAVFLRHVRKACLSRCVGDGRRRERTRTDTALAYRHLRQVSATNAHTTAPVVLSRRNTAAATEALVLLARPDPRPLPGNPPRMTGFASMVVFVGIRRPFRQHGAPVLPERARVVAVRLDAAWRRATPFPGASRRAVVVHRGFPPS